MQIFTAVCVFCLLLVVAILALAFFPPRRLLAALSRRSGVRFFFARSASHLPLRVALTIDDAPSAGTGLILDVLRSHGVPATFFIIGSNGASFPETLARMVAEGHELANHDWVDRRSAGVSVAALLEDMDRTSERVLRPAQTSPARWFRPGAGFFTASMVAAVRARFGYETVLADCYSHDIRLSHPSLIYAHMRLRVTNGSVMLLHDGSVQRAERTVRVLQKLLPALRAAGFEFGTLSQLKEDEVAAAAAAAAKQRQHSNED